ncbi:hypothetical protein BN961_03994 [Afipia felis]|uniref:Uncharacterized protein n=1 Tax=Afipia felis TaxID=1035 RepID=A0A090MWD4_AFIFE|nr:DUF3768 domain-containing protein [Afipia felis]CEG10554.1 hypothetical protein BN961_03994 [Afipia felis]
MLFDFEDDTYFANINYYASDMEYGSEDPSDTEATRRVIIGAAVSLLVQWIKQKTTTQIETLLVLVGVSHLRGRHILRTGRGWL